MSTPKYSFSHRAPTLTMEKLSENIEALLRKMEDNVIKKLTPPPAVASDLKINWETKTVGEKLAELKILVGPFCIGLEPKLWIDDLLTFADQVKLSLLFVLKNIEQLMDTSNENLSIWLKRTRPTIAFLTQKDADEKVVFEEFSELLQNAFSLEDMKDEARDKLERLHFKPGMTSVDEFVDQVVDLSRTVNRSVTPEQLVKMLRVKVPQEYRPFVDGSEVNNEYVFKRKLAMIVNAKIKFSGGNPGMASSVIVHQSSSRLSQSPVMSRRQFLGVGNTYTELPLE